MISLDKLSLILGTFLLTAGLAAAQPIAFTDVTVIDATGAPPQPGMTVIVSGDRVWGIGKTDSLEVPADATVINGRGNYLIPGLWDMHAHLDDALWKPGYNTTAEKEVFLGLLVANGVTGVRLMGDFIEQVSAWKQRILVGDLVGPRIVAADRPLEGGELPFPGWVQVETEAEAREAVRSQIRRGADFIKVYNGLTREAYLGIADEAHRLGVSFEGHPPYVVTAAEAAEAGQKSIEHLTGVTYHCTDSAAVFQQEIERAVAEKGRSLSTDPVHGVYLGWDPRIAASFNTEHCRGMLEAFVRHDTWHVPTLVVFSGIRDWTARGANGPREPDPRERHLPQSVPAYWRANYNIPAEALPILNAAVNTASRMTKALHEAGVQLMAGTDFATVPYVAPGVSLHEELELLVEAGLTPMEALQTATLHPALYLGRAHSGGTVEEGKLADLVLLKANPLEDIRNTRQIRAVVLNGRLFRKEDLLSLREPVPVENRRKALGGSRDLPKTGAAPPQLNDGWHTEAPDEVGLNPGRSVEMTRSIRNGEHGNVHAVLIEKDGRLVYEEYFTGEDETWRQDLGEVTFGRASLHDLRSVSKSIVSTLIGIAIDQGTIPSVDAPLHMLLPDYAHLLTGAKRAIRLRHVLSMSAGLEWNEWSVPYSDPTNDWQRLTEAEDPVAFVLERDLMREPGSTFTYHGGLTHLLAVILERATGEELEVYARRMLFEPLGIRDVVWWGDIGGLPSADAGLRMRPRDLAKLGSVFLRGGRWNGKQIVREEWTREVAVPRVEPGHVEPAPDFVDDVGYGYHWWNGRYRSGDQTLEVAMAYGNGQQRVMVIPDLSLAVTVLAGFYDSSDPTEIWAPDRLLMEYIIDAIVPQ